MKNFKKIFITGGAGFIGSHLTRTLLKTSDASVTVYDNFSSGQRWHFAEATNHPKLTIITADLKDKAQLTYAMQDHDLIIHLASNPDIAKALTQPDIDFWEGTYLTQNVLEAMRLNHIHHLLYASGSGIYGDLGEKSVDEHHAPMLPISTYGASKLACESLIHSYCHLFEINAIAFRFANVVGPNQTHGVGYDFIKKLLLNQNELIILGNGTQSKSYIYIDDVIHALLLLAETNWRGFDYFNLATEDYVTVKEIADLVVAKLNLNQVTYHYQPTDRGWKGDVPIVRFNCDKIRKKGWRNQKTSVEALTHAIDAMILAMKEKRMSV